MGVLDVPMASRRRCRQLRNSSTYAQTHIPIASAARILDRRPSTATRGPWCICTALQPHTRPWSRAHGCAANESHLSPPSLDRRSRAAKAPAQQPHIAIPSHAVEAATSRPLLSGPSPSPIRFVFLSYCGPPAEDPLLRLRRLQHCIATRFVQDTARETRAHRGHRCGPPPRKANRTRPENLARRYPHQLLQHTGESLRLTELQCQSNGRQQKSAVPPTQLTLSPAGHLLPA